MTGPRTDRTRWLRDQILAAVREHPGSTTQELVDAIDAAYAQADAATYTILLAALNRQETVLRAIIDAIHEGHR